MRYKILTYLFLLFFATVAHAQPLLHTNHDIPAKTPNFNIIPEPTSIITGDLFYIFPPSINILVSSNFYETLNEVELLSSFIEKICNIEVEILFDEEELINKVAHIIFTKDTVSLSKEGYSLSIGKDGVLISSPTDAGAFYAIQTLYQLMFINKSVAGEIELPFVSIIDAPRYPYRALMLDPARNFLPVSEIKRYIDVMSIYKFNRLHLHLTDNQGWRVEIKNLPQLTKTTASGSKNYYTQNELKDLVKYAAERYVEVIPEIDMPGHSVAGLAAFPSLSCNQRLLKIATNTNLSKELLCAGNPQVYDFIEIVIEELAPIFPSKYFHIGGDEVVLDNWKKCSKCQQVIKDNKLKNEQGLMGYFFKQVDSLLAINGKESMFWYEPVVPAYPANSVLYAWRKDTALDVIKKANENKCKVICSPNNYTYLDYPQWHGDIPNINWMPINNLQHTYEFDPTFDLPVNQTDCVLGVEACLWGEFIPNVDRAFYMTWPRALAISEAGSSEKQNRSWDKFKGKLETHFDFLLKHGISYRPPVELYKQEINNLLNDN